MLIMDEVRRLVEEKIKAHERRLHAAAERRMRASEVSFHISEEQIAGGGAALADIPGTVPPAWNWPKGCAFAPRCPYRDKMPECREEFGNS